MLTARPRLKSALAMLAASLFLAAAAPPALAQRIGTRAYTDIPLSLHQGPDTRYVIVGVVPWGTEVRVDRCSGLWCNIWVAHHSGWVLRYALSFGQGPHRQFWWDFV